MALNHNSNLFPKGIETEAKGDLPRNAFAHMGDVSDRETWQYPHHCIGGENNDRLFLSRDGLIESMEAAKDNCSDVGTKQHLAKHAAAIGMDVTEISFRLGISDEQYTDMISNRATTSQPDEGEKEKMKTIEQLQAMVDDLTAKLDAANSKLAEHQDKALEAKVTSLEQKIEAIEAEKMELASKVESLTASAESTKALAEIGTKAIEAIRADIHKLSAQIDGDGFEKEVLDTQLKAFGNNFELLTKFKTTLSARMKKMFSVSGEIPDGIEDPPDPKKQSAEADYKIGANIGGQVGGKIIPMK